MVKVYATRSALEHFSRLLTDQDDVQTLEKRSFLLKLLEKSLYVDYTDAELARLNKLRLPKPLGNKREQVAFSDFERRLVRWRQNAPNPIHGKKEIIDAMRNGYPVAGSELPNYFILNADIEVCRKRTEQYGVVCIGITSNGVHIDSEMWQAYSENTPDLFRTFCDMLSGIKKHIRFFRVFDQHFFSNHSTIDYRKFCQSIPHSVCRIGIHFCSDPNNRGAAVKSIGCGQVEEIISRKFPPLLPKLELVTDGMNRFDNHDRYIVSNQRIYVSGNTFSKSGCSSYVHSFPLGLYYDNLPEKIKTTIEKLIKS